ncbi:hypothetical protein ACFXHA_21825 [Nocardia sp. NPDC059240]|uniref:hypothetical protein n=1 Tax=Nocardia sp. NPDC059240 TaxID=3346786 RepID=UPI003679F1F6
MSAQRKARPAMPFVPAVDPPSGSRVHNITVSSAADAIRTFDRLMRADELTSSNNVKPISAIPSIYADGIPTGGTNKQAPVPDPAPATPNPQPAQPNPQPAQNPQSAQPIQDTQPAGPIPASPGQLEQPVVPAPAPVAVPADGTQWQSAPNTSSVVVPGSNGQTIDSTIHNTDNTTTEVRARAEAEGTYVWTAFADGSHSVTFIPVGGGPETTYTVPAGGDLVNGATSVTVGDGKGTWVTDGVSADGTPIHKVTEKLEDGVTYRDTSLLADGGTIAEEYRPGNPEFSTPLVVARTNSAGYGFTTDEQGRWEISPGADGKSKHTLLASDGSTVASREFAPNGDLLSFWSTTSDQTVNGSSLSDARAKAADDFNKYLAAKYVTSTPAELKDDPGLLARAQLIKVLDSLNADPTALVSIVRDKKGNLLLASFTGRDRVEHVSVPLEKLGETLRFDRHANGAVTDPDGNQLAIVDGVVMRFDKAGNLILPTEVGTGKAQTINQNNADGSPRTRKVMLADATTRDYAQIPTPEGAPSENKYYEVDGGGFLVDDGRGIWWATRPGEMLTISDHLWQTALDVALIVGPKIGGAALKGISGALKATPKIHVGAFPRPALTPPIEPIPAMAIPSQPASAAPASIAPRQVGPAVPSKTVTPQANLAPASTAANPHTMLPGLGLGSIPLKQLPFEVTAPIRANTLVQPEAAIAAQVKKVIFEAEAVTMMSAERPAVGAGGRTVNRTGTPRASSANSATPPTSNTASTGFTNTGGGGSLPPGSRGGAGRGGIGGRQRPASSMVGSPASSARATGSAPRVPKPKPKHGTEMRRAGRMEGPVVFRLPSNVTAQEIAQTEEYVRAANIALVSGKLSPIGRVSVKGVLKRAKESAAARERARAAAGGRPYGSDVAAHLPDTTWVGKGEPPGWGRHTDRINKVLGSQSGNYPVGYRPTIFAYEV